MADELRDGISAHSFCLFCSPRWLLTCSHSPPTHDKHNQSILLGLPKRFRYDSLSRCPTELFASVRRYPFIDLDKSDGGKLCIAHEAIKTSWVQRFRLQMNHWKKLKKPSCTKGKSQTDKLRHKRSENFYRFDWMTAENSLEENRTNTAHEAGARLLIFCIKIPSVLRNYDSRYRRVL